MNSGCVSVQLVQGQQISGPCSLLIFQAVHTASAACTGAHQSTHLPMKKPPSETSPPHSNQLSGDISSTQGKEAAQSSPWTDSSCSLTKWLVSVLQHAHLIAERTVLRRAPQQLQRLQEHLQDSWHCHLGTGFPGPASQAPRKG